MALTISKAGDTTIYTAADAMPQSPPIVSYSGKSYYTGLHSSSGFMYQISTTNNNTIVYVIQQSANYLLEGFQMNIKTGYSVKCHAVSGGQYGSDNKGGYGGNYQIINFTTQNGPTDGFTPFLFQVGRGADSNSHNMLNTTVSGTGVNLNSNGANGTAGGSFQDALGNIYFYGGAGGDGGVVGDGNAEGEYNGYGGSGFNSVSVYGGGGSGNGASNDGYYGGGNTSKDSGADGLTNGFLAGGNGGVAGIIGPNSGGSGSAGGGGGYGGGGGGGGHGGIGGVDIYGNGGHGGDGGDGGNGLLGGGGGGGGCGGFAGYAGNDDKPGIGGKGGNGGINGGGGGGGGGFGLPGVGINTSGHGGQGLLVIELTPLPAESYYAVVQTDVSMDMDGITSTARGTTSATGNTPVEAVQAAKNESANTASKLIGDMMSNATPTNKMTDVTSINVVNNVVSLVKE